MQLSTVRGLRTESSSAGDVLCRPGCGAANSCAWLLQRLSGIPASDLLKSAHIPHIEGPFRCSWDAAARVKAAALFAAMASTILGRLTTHGQSGHGVDVVFKGPYTGCAAADYDGESSR
jgi:hypothetical protein